MTAIQKRVLIAGIKIKLACGEELEEDIATFKPAEPLRREKYAQAKHNKAQSKA